MARLNKQAIDELMLLLNEVKNVTKLMEEFGITIDSDCWTATSFSDEENILKWKRKDFEQFDCINAGDKFFIGGNVVTGSQHQYDNEWITAPKKLAEVQSEIFKEYLLPVIESTPLKHFKTKFSDPYGLIDNCGWEHYFCIEVITLCSALEKEKNREAKKFYNAIKIIKNTKEINIKEFFENNNLKYLSVIYENGILHLGGTKQNNEMIIEKYKCTPEIVAIVFLEIINTPTFVTANLKKPDNVTVQYERFR